MLNNSASREAHFTSALTGFSFGCALPVSPVLHSRIEAIIAEMERESENSIKTLRGLREHQK